MAKQVFFHVKGDNRITASENDRNNFFCQKLMQTSASRILKRTPIQVLTGPYVVYLLEADETSCGLRDTAVNTDGH